MHESASLFKLNLHESASLPIQNLHESASLSKFLLVNKNSTRIVDDENARPTFSGEPCIISCWRNRAFFISGCSKLFCRNYRPFGIIGSFCERYNYWQECVKAKWLASLQKVEQNKSQKATLFF